MLECFDNFFFFFFCSNPTGGCGDGSGSGQQEFLYLLGFLRPDIFRNTPPHTWVFLHIFSITFPVHFLLLHCLSFFFSSLSPCVLLGLSSAHLAFLFIFLSFFCFTD